ncbi:MAG: hypothetical protein K0S76_182 [Herbinix sp.]|jgi:hypothetical protein|nr:hypothetical protein [Herbinix sp.]
MSRKTNEFKVLATATELISKHMNLKSFEQKGTAESAQALINAYKTAETSLIATIQQEIQQIKTIDSLTRFFRESCYSLSAVSLRYDLLQKMLIGKSRTGAEALREAIEDGVEEDKFPEWGVCCGDSKGLSLSNEAFDLGAVGACETDKRSLVTMILLDYVVNMGYTGLKVASVMADLAFSCCRMLIDGATKDRSVIGYYEEYEYIIEGANKTFIELFATKLNELLAHKESIKALEMKQYLQDQVIMAWTGSSITKPMEVYTEIERFIATNKTTKEVSTEVVSDLSHSRDFSVSRRYGSNGVTYELNREGLKCFVELLNALGLSELQEVAMISNKIREAIV